MLALELACLAIVTIHLGVSAVRTPPAAAFLRRAALVSVAAFVAEDSCMRLYGFYAYNPDWWPFVDRLPLMVALIWPGVVLSAGEVAGYLLGGVGGKASPRVPVSCIPTKSGRPGFAHGAQFSCCFGRITSSSHSCSTGLVSDTAMPPAGGRSPRALPALPLASSPPRPLFGYRARGSASAGAPTWRESRGSVRVPLVAGLLVLADAAFMEAIAVKAGLWRWFEPGLFGVPPVGILGWALFSGACVAWLRRVDLRGGGAGAEVALVVVAPVFTHAGLLAAWWGALRWVNVPLPSWGVVAGAWAVSLVLLVWSLRSGARHRVPPGAMLTRIPAALFFLGLMVLYARDDPALWAFALAFAPPYISLTRLPGTGGGGATAGTAD